MTTYRELCAQIAEALPVVRAAEAANPSQVFIAVTWAGETRSFKPGALVRGYTDAAATCATRAADDAQVPDGVFLRVASAMTAEARRRRAAGAPGPWPEGDQRGAAQPQRDLPRPIAIPPRSAGAFSAALFAALGLGAGVVLAWVFR